MDEVLDGVDVAEPDRAILAKALPIIKRIAVVAQNRRTLEPFRSVDERLGDVARERLCRLRTDLVDIGGEAAELLAEFLPIEAMWHMSASGSRGITHRHSRVVAIARASSSVIILLAAHRHLCATKNSRG